ncbi:hypothetical protein NPIL_281431 [Nephila pilipes]|uniref:Uncharacterized protein n=1 Tax=Nephila pilipes TaxID=299642 RepID=A0A8X6P4U8_NEPPI|nr:hypothetical protein NPIL_281431 [Nephila pilipes]
MTCHRPDSGSMTSSKVDSVGIMEDIIESKHHLPSISRSWHILVDEIIFIIYAMDGWTELKEGTNKSWTPLRNPYSNVHLKMKCEVSLNEKELRALETVMNDFDRVF